MNRPRERSSLPIPLRRWLSIAWSILLATTTAAAADPADDRLHAATLADARGDHAGALAAMVAVADDFPDSPWAPTALASAARIAERDGDPARAAALLVRLADRYPTHRQAGWARSHAAELAQRADPRWREVSAAHDAAVAAVGRKGDPRPHLAELARLVDANPGYPRATAARIWLGDRWREQGAWDRALAAYRAAAATPGATAIEGRLARLGIIAALIALDDFTAADRELAALAADPAADPIAIARARDDLATQRARRAFRIAAWIVLALAAALALIALYRTTGSARAAARALVRPPIEAWFLAPVAAIVIAVSSTGNALVASAVRWILIGGVAVTWMSGAVLAITRNAPRWRLALHLIAVAAAAGAVLYLAIARDRLPDLLLETWKHGPEPR